MYHVSAQGVDERMINVHYYYYSFLKITLHLLLLLFFHCLYVHRMVYWQRCVVVTWLVQRETAAVSAQVLCTPYNHAQVHSVTSLKAT